MTARRRLCWAGALTAALPWTLVPAAPAQAPCGPLHYGAATAGSGGVAPTVSAGGGAATLGNAALTVDAGGVPAGALLAHVLGFARTSTPLFGVDVLVDAALIAPATASQAGG